MIHILRIMTTTEVAATMDGNITRWPFKFVQNVEGQVSLMKEIHKNLVLFVKEIKL